MPEDFGLGSISRTRLTINFNNNQTVWYIPMYNYDGTIYVSQINVGGSLAASCVLNVNALTSVSTTMSGGATAGSNIASGPNNGLQFTGIDLRYYSLVVMFVGTNAGDFKFQGNNPAYGSYTLTSGTPPTIGRFNTTPQGNITRLAFYSTGAINLGQWAPLAGNKGQYGGTSQDRSSTNIAYTSYILSGTATPNDKGGTSGANCLAMSVDSANTNTLSAKINSGSEGHAGCDCTLTTAFGTFTCSVNSNNKSGSFDLGYIGGAAGGNNTTVGSGGGSAGPGGDGYAGSSSSPYNTVGGASIYYHNLGSNGKVAAGSTWGGDGGAGTFRNNYPNPNYGLVVVVLYGFWDQLIPGPG